MKLGIQTADDDINRVNSFNMTINSTLSNPLIETTVNPRKFDTLNYTFKSEPAIGAITGILSFPHGYDYRPVFFPYYATDYNGGSLSSFSLLKYLLSDAPAPPLFLTNSIELYAVVDSKNVYFRVRKGDGFALTNLINSNWIFSYRIYALDAGDVDT